MDLADFILQILSVSQILYSGNCQTACKSMAFFPCKYQQETDQTIVELFITIGAQMEACVVICIPFFS